MPAIYIRNAHVLAWSGNQAPECPPDPDAELVIQSVDDELMETWEQKPFDAERAHELVPILDDILEDMDRRTDRTGRKPEIYWLQLARGVKGMMRWQLSADTGRVVSADPLTSLSIEKCFADARPMVKKVRASASHPRPRPAPRGRTRG